MQNETLEIAIASDDVYAEFVTIALVSLLENNKSFPNIRIHLLSNAITESNIEIISNLVSSYQRLLCIYKVNDIKERLGIAVPQTISISSYLRLFLASIIPNKVNKILYIDTDAIINKSLETLWKIDLKDNLVAGVLDSVSTHAKFAIGLKSNEAYINAGFLLINLLLWRKENIEYKFLQFLLDHKGIVYHHDQGLINIICRGRKLILPIQYNMVTNFFVFPYRNYRHILPFYSEEEFLYGRENPVYIHFTAGVANRPWMKHCRHPQKQLFLDYRSKTVYAYKPLYKDNRKVSLKILSFLFYRIPCLYYFVLCIRASLKERL